MYAALLTVAQVCVDGQKAAASGALVDGVLHPGYICCLCRLDRDYFLSRAEQSVASTLGMLLHQDVGPTHHLTLPPAPEVCQYTKVLVAWA